MKNQMRRVCFFSTTFLLMSCLSTRQEELPQSWIRSVTQKMRNGCKLKDSSGFSADIILNNSSSARVEAIWDDKGRFSGQLINTLGEDFLSFHIDEQGQFKTNQEIEESESLFNALDLLAQIGSEKTRYLLCSGLFISDSLSSHVRTAQQSADLDTKLVAMNTVLRLRSSISPLTSSSKIVQVKSKVSTDSWIFPRSVAQIDWEGRIQDQKILPLSLTVATDVTAIRLSFLDFD